MGKVMKREKKQAHKRGSKKRIALCASIALLVTLTASFFIYTGVYYKADDAALAALSSTETVTVAKTDYGYFFDSPSETDALIFYPGGKVEETAYAPLLRDIASGGCDVFLVKMPFRLAFFDQDKAGEVISETSYERYFIGGHSLGGVSASSYAAEHPDEIDGLLLCAAYSVKDIPESIPTLSMYGSLDTVLSRGIYERCKRHIRGALTEYVIEGGNHAYFGSYGEQRGDGKATITPDEQRTAAAQQFFEQLQ